ncbi:preprotein translocase subunit SecA [Anaerohalosphaeraceae bacterium U12dextr]
MAFSLSRFLVKIFGSRNERLVKGYMRDALAAGAFEEQVKALDDEALKAKTAEFKQRLASGQQPSQILPEAFAVVREAARRNNNMRHFDVQLIGGNVLFDGKIAEMATGEGKTLVATLAAYLVHLTGKHVHVITVNDYLAKRDAEWMGPVYRALGLTVGAIQSDMDTIGEERRAQYECDITYGTNNEFGFDYLRDNMKSSLAQMVQGPLEYAIIDEVDSILIDEARTPLIISGPAQDDVTRYKKADAVARQIISLQSSYDRLKKTIDEAEKAVANARGELAEAKQAKDSERMEKAQRFIDQTLKQIEQDKARLETMTQYYEVEYDRKAAHLTHEGIGKAQEIAGVGSFFTGSNMDWPHLLEQALRAHVVYEREKEYVVMDGKVIIVDEFTGRLMHGRQWSDGLHQAVEAKEGVPIKEETQTLATITLQNFFKLYERIAGMTGTASTEAEEFMNIYKLDVVTIPTNRPCIREDRDDMIFKTVREKFNALVEEIHATSVSGRPVLVGTTSVEKSEALSQALSRRYGLEHEVLNAKQHAREALIVEKAGHQHTARDGSMRGNVTIATNMAGRGTDIKLGPGVRELGGLHVVGTERHEARRIDNQLRGRTGRQGDPGSSVFFLSFDDDLMSIFAPEWTVKALSMIGWQEGEPIYHPSISRGIAKAQKKVEQRNFEIRKSLLEYDEVMDYQRKIFYTRRRNILAGKDLRGVIEEMLRQVSEQACKTVLSPEYPYQCIIEWAKIEFGVDLEMRRIRGQDADYIEELLRDEAKKSIENTISVSLGEYLEDYEDPSTWNISELTRWAMSAFQVSVSASKLKQMKADEIEHLLIDAACGLVDKKDLSRLKDFLSEDFAVRTFAQWAGAKFAIQMDPAELKDKPIPAVHQKLLAAIEDKYRQREIEYPVEFAMSMVFGQQGPNAYAFQSLADWANQKYQTRLTAEQLTEMKPEAIYHLLLEESRSWHESRLAAQVEQYAKETPDRKAQFAKERFGVDIPLAELADAAKAQEKLLAVGREFMRSELSNLERYVLIQIFDVAWKDHLYAMDHLKESIMLRAYAEKDPKIEYKHEGYKMFTQMLNGIAERVTDIIFKVRLQAGERARSVYQVSRTHHDQTGQFEAAQRQRAAAMAPQGEQTVKTIRHDKPQVGRNDPCPCGSGKKYKKCCGQNT